MKRIKDEYKDVAVAMSTVGIGGGKFSNASPHISSSSNDANNGTAGTVRTTGRVKKPKLVYDPSDNYISRGSRSSLPAPSSSPSSSAASTAVTAPAAVAASPPTTIAALAPAAAATATATVTIAAVTSLATSQQAQNINSVPQSQNMHVNATESVAPPLATGSAGEESADNNVASMPSAEQFRNYDTCIKCHKSEPKRGSGYKSNFLACKACMLKWHFTCLPITFEILTNARKRYKCEKCRRCRVCGNTAKGSDKFKDLIMCCACATVYHPSCHWPRVLPNKQNDPTWKCYGCDPGYNALDTDDDVAQIESHSPPRKSKAGRKKRATSDPAELVPIKKLAVDKQLITKNGTYHKLCDQENNKKTAAATSTTKTTTTTAAVTTATAPAVGLVVPSQESEPSKAHVKPDATMAPTPKSQPLTPQTTPPTLELPIPVPVTTTATAKNKPNGEVVAGDVSVGQKLPVHNWNVEQVVNYVRKFYPQQSNVFKCQEIDGAALMVLTRQDIIERFGLKLGPALRLYELILSMQSSTDDVFLGWCE